MTILRSKQFVTFKTKFCCLCVLLLEHKYMILIAKHILQRRVPQVSPDHCVVLGRLPWILSIILLLQNTSYKGEYHRYHLTIVWFWDVFHGFSLSFYYYRTLPTKESTTGITRPLCGSGTSSMNCLWSQRRNSSVSRIWIYIFICSHEGLS